MSWRKQSNLRILTPDASRPPPSPRGRSRNRGAERGKEGCDSHGQSVFLYMAVFSSSTILSLHPPIGLFASYGKLRVPAQLFSERLFSV